MTQPPLVEMPLGLRNAPRRLGVGVTGLTLPKTTLYEDPQEYLSEKIQQDLEEDVADFIGAPEYRNVRFISGDPLISELTQPGSGITSNLRHGITAALNADQIAQNITSAIDPFNLGYGQVIGRPIGMMGANVLGLGHEVFGSGGLFKKASLEDLAANLAGSVYGFQNPGFAESYKKSSSDEGINYLRDLLGEGMIQNFLRSDMFDVKEQYQRAQQNLDLFDDTGIMPGSAPDFPNVRTIPISAIQDLENKLIIEQKEAAAREAALRAQAANRAANEQAATTRENYRTQQDNRVSNAQRRRNRERQKDRLAERTGKSRGFFGGR
tara:strand:+ start:46 stop:1017 length:972 start_codon:yes stop_codon:yes gene_type:complete